MLLGFAIVRRREDFRLNAATGLGDFLGPFVNQEDDELDFGMIGDDGGGDLLQKDRLAGSRRCDDESALPLADRREQVDDSRAERLGAVSSRMRSRGSIAVRSSNPLRREGAFNRAAADFNNVRQANAATADDRFDRPVEVHPLSQPVFPNQAGVDDRVVAADSKVAGRVAQEAVSIGMHLQNPASIGLGCAHVYRLVMKSSIEKGLRSRSRPAGGSSRSGEGDKTLVPT